MIYVLLSIVILLEICQIIMRLQRRELNDDGLQKEEKEEINTIYSRTKAVRKAGER